MKGTPEKILSEMEIRAKIPYFFDFKFMRIEFGIHL